MAYDTVLSMWRAVFLNTLAFPVFLFIIVGLVASLLHLNKLAHIVLVTILSAFIGLAVSALLAAVPSLLIAAIYSSIPADMSSVEAAVLGSAQGVAIGMLNSGILHRVL
ncbi:hypothetical protein BWQ96_04620 [Gracilariopsis chorda]|uniref:Uncharacterized protein n=1 Tax=Gracilariopsis chorda TaxID=448386 RepID=A0A2V3IU32_9FLOR|nr:hypothetical protein BWQ96_04620 [Gracilariopsis chorda]|eukprot:PXF45615.1 hypothetical protein BWQ96_04620 [Gracilariopsis chorda]